MKSSMIVTSILVCVTCTVVLIITVLIYIFLLRGKEKPPEPIIITTIKAAQLKCIEYAKVACDNPNPSDRKSRDISSSRIVGGREVAEGTFPHMVLLDVEKPTSCTGTLISEKFVMTSAYCVYDSKQNNVTLRLKMGAVDLLGNNKRHIPSFNEFFNNRTGSIYYTDEIIVHEEYNPNNETTWMYNIALLKLATKVEFDWRKRPICLNTNYSSVSRKNMTTSGWGFEGSFFNRHLRIADQYIENDEIKLKCASNFPSLINNTICAGNRDISEGLCYGDRGSPLQIRSEIENTTLCVNTFDQVGIAFNYTCWAPFDVPLLGLYTEVARLIDWIVPLVWPEMFLYGPATLLKNKTADNDSKN